MKGKNLFKSHLLLFFVMISASVSAQDKNIWPANPVIVNGTSDEWLHSLMQYNAKSKLSYSIANDATNLYILIESADQVTNAKILANSITLSINSKGKKKNLKTLTFPVIDPVDLARSKQVFSASNGGATATSNPGNLQNDILSASDNIKISGFFRIPAGTYSLGFVNTYGIKAAAKIDQNKVLIYEISIPLSRLNISINQKKSVAYNIKINGSPEKTDRYIAYDPYGGRTPGGRPGVPTTGGIPTIGRIPGSGGDYIIPRGGNTRGGNIRIGGTKRPSSKTSGNSRREVNDTKSVDFWLKYKLAKTKSKL